MAEQGDLEPEGVFEVVWRQHQPNDWMAEVRDIRSNQRCQVYSLEELERFIQAHLPVGKPASCEHQR